jgi:glycosyltransferase involved in cell wall biosynthesis
MKVIAFLTEPASYTIDLVKNVHIPNQISYKYLFNLSYTRPNSNEIYSDDLFLNKLSLIKQFKVIRNDYRTNDAIIFNGYDSISFLFLWLVHVFSKHKKPIAIESDTPLKIPSNFFKRLVKKWYLSHLFKNPYLHGLAGGNNSQKKLFSYYGMSSERIHFLPMVVDVNQFKYPPLRERHEKFTFLYVGRFIPLKQIECIIDEFLIKFRNDSSVQLVLVGDGESYAGISENYSNLENVIFKGRLSAKTLQKEFELANVLVLASNNENWGLVINEAMSAAIPILSNVGIGANYDLIEDKDTGLIFDSSVEGALANKMDIIYKNKELYQVCSKNAYSLMHEYWNFKLYSKQLKLALSKMVNEK